MLLLELGGKQNENDRRVRNPGTKYQYTKHNIGFMVVDKIAREHQATFKNPFEAEVAEFFIMEKRSF